MSKPISVQMQTGSIVSHLQLLVNEECTSPEVHEIHYFKQLLRPILELRTVDQTTNPGSCGPTRCHRLGPTHANILDT